MVKIYHRRYPDTQWDYKAVSTEVGNKEIIYDTLSDHGKKSQGVEIYSGRNYDVGSNERSYSRKYKLSEVPKIYKKTVAMLKRVHKKTKWSKEKEVDYN